MNRASKIQAILAAAALGFCFLAGWPQVGDPRYQSALCIGIIIISFGVLVGVLKVWSPTMYAILEMAIAMLTAFWTGYYYTEAEVAGQYRADFVFLAAFIGSAYLFGSSCVNLTEGLKTDPIGWPNWLKALFRAQDDRLRGPEA